MSLIVKICGIKSRPVLDAALEAGADWVGFMFFPMSPRNISLSDAVALGKAARNLVKTVAVTVDPDDRLLDEIAGRLEPDFVQFHGSEAPERLAEFREKSGIGTIKALGIQTEDDVARAARYRDAADWLILDAKAPAAARRPGGHGRPFDWSLIEHEAPNLRWLLSGGLRAENVAQALVQTGANGADVSSGVEVEKGVKDPDLIRKFVKAVRAVENATAA